MKVYLQTLKHRIVRAILVYFVSSRVHHAFDLVSVFPMGGTFGFSPREHAVVKVV